MSIRDNIMEVRRRIAAACERSGRDPEEVRLIAVSKTKPVSMIEEAVSAGQNIFGENRPQELRDKYALLPSSLQWHMIGHLQKNKIKYVVGRACMIHSIDSLDLAEAVNEQAAKSHVIMPVLVEVNAAGEESKFGVRPEETEALVRAIAGLENIRVKGLMTIAPNVEDPQLNRPYFRQLKQLCIDIGQKNIDNVSMIELSMGMTGDYEVAVEEGATFVRVGTGIFGDRRSLDV